jgi:hypothetical protein
MILQLQLECMRNSWTQTSSGCKTLLCYNFKTTEGSKNALYLATAPLHACYWLHPRCPAQLKTDMEFKIVTKWADKNTRTSSYWLIRPKAALINTWKTSMYKRIFEVFFYSVNFFFFKETEKSVFEILLRLLNSVGRLLTLRLTCCR